MRMYEGKHASDKEVNCREVRIKTQLRLTSLWIKKDFRESDARRFTVSIFKTRCSLEKGPWYNTSPGA